MQTKTIVRYYAIPIRMANIQKTESVKFGKDSDQLEILFIANGNAKWGNHYGREHGSIYQLTHIRRS